MRSTNTGRHVSEKAIKIMRISIVEGRANKDIAKELDIQPQVVSRTKNTFVQFYMEKYSKGPGSGLIQRTLSLPESTWKMIDKLIDNL